MFLLLVVWLTGHLARSVIEQSGRVSEKLCRRHTNVLVDQLLCLGGVARQRRIEDRFVFFCFIRGGLLEQRLERSITLRPIVEARSKAEQERRPRWDRLGITQCERAEHARQRGIPISIRHRSTAS